MNAAAASSVIPSGRVQALRALFENNSAKPASPIEFEQTKAQVARHNLTYFSKRRRQSATAGEPITATATTQHTTPDCVEFDDDGTSFWLMHLDHALLRGDVHAANRSVLLFFLQEFAPDRVHEVDDLLLANRGKEPELFAQLVEQYPNPYEHYVVFANCEEEEEDDNWAKFGEEEEMKPILNGMRRPSGIWTVNYNPWDAT